MHKDHQRLPLPCSSANEDLETISRNRLSLLFDPKFFELRTENTRDKGVDLFVELKRDGFYTNFRFAIQLKSTNSIKKNSDGSISYPVEVSNLNYLMNLSIAPYYILYDHQEEVFYYERAFAAYQVLLKKYTTENIPSQFKIRFSKILTAEVILDIYDSTLKRGNLYREINPHLDYAVENKTSSGIIIDQDNQVYNVEQNVAYIERFGLAMIDDAAFGAILEIEQRSHPRNTVSPMFNLVCGLAYFYKGKVFRALDFLRMADKNKMGFDPVLKSMLTYTLLQAQHRAGILTVKKLKTKTLLLMEGDDIGSFLEIEKAWAKLEGIAAADKEKMLAFYDSIKRIIEGEADNPKARIMGYMRVIDADLICMMSDLGKNLFSAVVSVNPKNRQAVIERLEQFEKQFISRINSLMEYAGKWNDLQAMANVSRMRIEWFYRKEFVFHFYDHWNFATLQSDGEISEALKKKFEKHLGFLDEVDAFFISMEQDEFMLMALMLKYKILHFLKDKVLQDVEIKIRDICASKDLDHLEKRFQELIKKGTDHELYVADATMRLGHVYKLAKNSGIEQYLFPTDKDRDLTRDADLQWTIDGDLMEFDFPAIERHIRDQLR